MRRKIECPTSLFSSFPLSLVTSPWTQFSPVLTVNLKFELDCELNTLRVSVFRTDMSELVLGFNGGDREWAFNLILSLCVWIAPCFADIDGLFFLGGLTGGGIADIFVGGTGPFVLTLLTEKHLI